MSNLFDIVNTVSVALNDPEGFDWAEVDKAMVEIHAKLTETKWAIEDEKLRDEMENLVISWAAKRYLMDSDQAHPNSEMEK
jgi:hypothetical protein